MTNYADIRELLPHKAPMILIDKVIEITELSVHAQVTISGSGLFFDKTVNAVPGWVGIEFMAQTIAAWSGHHARNDGLASPIGFLLGSRRYTSNNSEFALGKTLDIHAEKLMENEGMAAFSCTISCDGKELASSQLNVFVPSQDKLQSILGE